MNRRLALATGLTATLMASVAGAQEVTIGYQGLPYKASGESNTGIQVSDGALLHVGAGAEAGYDTNVFYDNTPVGSGIIRVLPYAELSNATRTGPVSRQLVFDLRAGVQYRHYLSDDVNVKKYDNAFMPSAGVSLSSGSGGQLGFGLANSYARIEDPPYGAQAANGPITRDNNQASAEVRWSPGGGRLSVVLRYTNMVDVFENTSLPGAANVSYSYANSDTNYLMLDAAWKWLPKTAIFVNAQQGYIFYLNDQSAQKVPSYPLRLTVGLRGLLTEKTAAVLSFGYANAFYSSGESTGGLWGSTNVGLVLTARPTMLSRVALGYSHDFENAVIASFSYNETVYASYVQQVAGRLALDLSGRYSHRAYQGNFIDTAQSGRVDNFFQVGASLDYFIRNWTYLGVAYALMADDVNVPPAPAGMMSVPSGSLNYVKQQMFVRLGVTY